MTYTLAKTGAQIDEILADVERLLSNLEAQGAYGFRHDPVNNTFLTIGGATSPVHEAIRGVVLDTNTGEEVYELLSTDFTLKSDGTTASNLTGTDGQVTIAFSKCWTGVFRHLGYDYYLVADQPIPGLVLHPAFMVGGPQRDYRYMGKYQAVWNDNGTHTDHDGSTSANTTDDAIASVSGFTPITAQTRATFRTLADNAGTGNKYWLCDMHLQRLAMLLHYTAPGIRDAANPFYSYDNVPGHTEESGFDYANTKASGLTNSLGLTDGSITDGGIVVANNILGIENLFGSIWEWRDGININDHMPYMCSNPANFADDTTTNYEQVLDQYGSVVLMPNTNQYQKSWHAGTMFPSSVHSASSTFITDFYWQNPGWRLARVGGSSSNGAWAGVACLYVHHVSGSSVSNLGGRIAS